MNSEEKTIAAIATPPGEGGIAVIRICGKKAFAIANAVFSGSVFDYASHTVHFGHVLDEKGGGIDEVLLLVMHGPNTYTGEDTVEIFCHGGVLITRNVLDVVYQAGAIPAGPGEFSYKAFMNGKIDLSQAEAIQALIGAKNAHALNAASEQLRGSLSEKISSIQERLTHIAAIIEAWVDFPDEGLEFASKEEILSSLENIEKEIAKLCDSFHDGKKLSTGFSLVLSGTPNVGKSSLMNALLEEDRAIVTPIAGTTRDILQDEMSLGGFNFRLLDTAGIRETEEVIEKEGVLRSKKALENADLILFILDAQKNPNDEEKKIISSLPKKKTLIIWNKIDLPHEEFPSFIYPSIALSAKTGEGIDGLKKTILEMIWENPPSKEEIIITKERHFNALKKAKDGVLRALKGLESALSPEFLAIDLRESLENLGTIIGRNISEDILDAIFSTFCVGK